MIVVLAFYQGDASQAANLLRWIKDIGGCPEHNLLLVADAGIQWSVGFDMIALGNKAFKNAGFITTKDSIQGWPQGANALFRVAAQHCKDHHTSFLWLEPDAVPTRSTWLKEIHDAYIAIGKGTHGPRKPFMGRIYSGNNPSAPAKSMSGIAVYPENAIDLIGNFIDGPNAFDMAMSDAVVPQCENTKLIQHFWGPNRELAPTFARVRTPMSPINTFTLESLDPNAAIFHRNKDGTLIKVLRSKLGVKSDSAQTFAIIIPACNKDALLAVKNIKWITKLGRCPEHDAILAVDSDMVTRYLEPLKEAAKQAFRSITMFKYRCSSIMTWPEGANIAFRNVCGYMHNGKTPWLWMEPDAVPLKRNWQNILQEEYDSCDKLFMGPIVPGMGHMNGVGIYPAETASIIPKSIDPNLPRHIAWDSAMKEEMIHLCHDASHVIQHVWGIVEGKCHPIMGDSPIFVSRKDVENWVNPEAALFHRCKDGSIIDRLSEIMP